MHTPITKFIAAAQILPSRLPPKVNGRTIVTTVARAMIQPKKAWGRGVMTDSRCARPVAINASTNAVIA